MERPQIKDKEVLKYVEYLEAKLENPIAKVYISIKEPIEKLAESIKNIELDITSESSDKTFDRIIKYMVEIRKVIENLDYIRSKMNPEDVKRIDQESKMENLGIAEKLALRKQS